MTQEHKKTIEKLPQVKEMTGCLLDYPSFKEKCKLISIDVI